MNLEVSLEFPIRVSKLDKRMVYRGRPLRIHFEIDGILVPAAAAAAAANLQVLHGKLVNE
jgi:hypothetical protein